MSTTTELTAKDIEYMNKNGLRLVVIKAVSKTPSDCSYFWPRVKGCCPYKGERPCVVAPKPTDGDPCICPYMAAGSDFFVFCSYDIGTKEVTEEEKLTFGDVVPLVM